jgi:hypothetical protein
MLLVTRSRSESAPFWVVSNGSTTVGPVDTDLLVRGVLEGRIPSDCLVRDVRSETWRTLDQVREVRALWTGPEAASLRGFERARKVLDQASDFSEAFLFMLHGAVRATRSCIGLLHRTRDPLNLPITSCVVGVADERLGEVVPNADPVLAVARRGELVLGQPSDGNVERSIAQRLASDLTLGGVAMVPVLEGTELLAFLELGRLNHPYRQSDGEALQRLAALTANRLEELSWQA